jgi:hypothetical protein
MHMIFYVLVNDEQIKLKTIISYESMCQLYEQFMAASLDHYILS